MILQEFASWALRVRDDSNFWPVTVDTEAYLGLPLTLNRFKVIEHPKSPTLRHCSSCRVLNAHMVRGMTLGRSLLWRFPQASKRCGGSFRHPFPKHGFQLLQLSRPRLTSTRSTMSRDIIAEIRAICQRDEASFPIMEFYALMRFNPVAALKDLGLDGDPDNMEEALKLHQSLSTHLVYILVSSN